MRGEIANHNGLVGYLFSSLASSIVKVSPFAVVIIIVVAIVSIIFTTVRTFGTSTARSSFAISIILLRMMMVTI